MIYLLHGENEFLRRERLKVLLDGMSDVERLDGEAVTKADLLDIFRGQTLFSDRRTVIISGLSEGEAWQDLPEAAVESDNAVILLEQKVDKRTKTYKWLQKNAKVEAFEPWGERDSGRAIGWCVQRAKDEHGFTLSNDLAAMLVGRLGVDQLRLDSVLGQLALADKVDAALIDAVVPLAKSESVFGLFEAALEGRVVDIQRIVTYFEQTEGSDAAYMTMGLLASQLVNLNALVLSGGNSAKVAADFGVNPYALRGLVSYSKRMNVDQIRRMNDIFMATDRQMKTTSVEPWMLVEMALVEAANLRVES